MEQNIPKKTENRSFSKTVISARQNSPRLIAVGGGKGGVGKTLYAVSLGLYLQQSGKKVVLVDSDFASPSLNNLFHTIEIRKQAPISSPKKMSYPIQKTSFENLMLIGGHADILGLPEYWLEHLMTFLKRLRQLKADYIILDLGSGNLQQSVALFNSADERIVITNPEPTAILESFTFLKLCQYEFLKHHFQDKPKILNFITAAFKNNSDKNTPKLLRLIKELKADRNVKILNPKLILNMQHTALESQDVYALQLVCTELLGLHLNYQGSIAFDEDIRTHLKLGSLNYFLKNQDILTVNEKIFGGDNGTKKSSLRGIKFRNFEHLKTEDVICSVNCTLWDNCSYQRGGYPCRIKYIGFINTRTKD